MEITFSCVEILYSSTASLLVLPHVLANSFLLNVFDSLCIITPFFFTRIVPRKLNYPLAFWRLSIVTEAIEFSLIVLPKMGHIWNT